MEFKILSGNREFYPFRTTQQKQWERPFFFVQAADTQLGMIENYLEKKPNPRWDKEVLLCKKAIEKVNMMDPKPLFMIVCGDLVDAWPDHELREDQENDFKKTFSQLHPEVPLVCVCGNHDVGNVPNKANIDRFRSVFGDDFFSFWCGGCFFVVLNSQLLVDRSEVPEYAELQDQWLEEQLREARSMRATHIVAFQHVPLFTNDAWEPDNYFNIPIKTRTSMLKMFSSYGVTHVFCGHYHRNAGGRADNVEVVVTSAIGAQLGDDIHGVRIVTVRKDEISHEYFSLDDIPQNISL